MQLFRSAFIEFIATKRVFGFLGQFCCVPKVDFEFLSIGIIGRNHFA